MRGGGQIVVILVISPKYTMLKVSYYRTGFSCENLIIVNCKFFLEFANF